MMVSSSVGQWLLLQATLTTVASVTVQVSVPEGHSLILNCSSPSKEAPSRTEWKLSNGEIIAIRDGYSVYSANPYRYALLPDESLLMQDLQPGDAGEYLCNEYMVANVEILRGQEYKVNAGRMLLLPCAVSEKLKQKWQFRRNRHTRRLLISVKYRNGSVTKECHDPHNRFQQTDRELRISKLQPSDAGEYFCNSFKVASLHVIADNTKQNNSEETDADADDTENEDSRPVPLTVLTVVATGGCVLVLLAALCTLALYTRRRRRNKETPCEQEKGSFLHSDRASHGGVYHAPVLEEREVQYASLGHQNWRDRPPASGEGQHVIYSAVAGDNQRGH